MQPLHEPAKSRDELWDSLTLYVVEKLIRHVNATMAAARLRFRGKEGHFMATRLHLLTELEGVDFDSAHFARARQIESGIGQEQADLHGADSRVISRHRGGRQKNQRAERGRVGQFHLPEANDRPRKRPGLRSRARCATYRR